MMESRRTASASAPRPRFFYGWVIVVLAGLTQAISVGQSYLNGVLIASFNDMFDVSTHSILMATTGIMMVSYGIASTCFGMLSGRIALRYFAAIVFAAMALGYLCLAAVNGIWQVGAVYALLFGLGQIGLPISQTMIAHWFVARRGIAFGIAACGLALPGFLVAPLMTYSIMHYGFSLTMLVYGLLIAMFIPLILGLVIEWPEQLGLSPNGAAKPETAIRNAEETEPAMSSSELLKTPLFWLVAFTVTIGAMIVTQLMTYVVPMAKAANFDTQAASFFLSAIAFTALASKLITGWLADRMPFKLLAVLPALLVVISCLIFLVSTTFAGYLIASLVAGLGGGTANIMIPMVIAKIFGRTSFAAVAGLTIPVLVVLSFTATWSTGHIVDLTGSYNFALRGFIALATFGGILALMLPDKQCVVAKRSTNDA